MRNTALCYVRKSLVKQGAIDPASPDVQRRQLTSWCETAGLAPEWHEDAEGHQSGMRSDRPGWQAVRARLADPDVAVLAVTAWDRAARSVRELLDVTDACQKSGVRFVATGDNIDTRTADGRLQLTILAGVAEHYSRRVGEWRAASIDALRRNRGRHYGTPPFGTRRVPLDGDLVLVPSDLQQPNGTDHECLTLVYEWFAVERMAYYGIARRLNGEGWRYRDRYGSLRAWTHEDVRRCIKSHWTYAGNVIIGQADRGTPEIIPGSHDPILPERLTTVAGYRSRQFRALGPRHSAPRSYPLTGLLFCAACGLQLRGMGQEARAYGTQHACEAGSKHYWAAEPIEANVRAYLAGLRYPEQVISMADQVASQHLLATSGPDDGARERAQAALDRLIDLYASGAITKDEFTRKRAEYEARIPKAAPTLAAAPLLAIGDMILEVPPMMLRDIARAMLERIEVGRGGLAITPKDWCAAWAGGDGIHV